MKIASNKPENSGGLLFLFHWMNLLCIDVAIGALCSGYFAAILLEAALPAVFWVVLPLSVWIVYTADHVVDAYRLKDKAHTYRHLFIYRHLKTFLVLSAVLIMLDLGLVVFFLDFQILLFGLAVGAVTSLYFLFLHRRRHGTISWLSKELSVALIYVLGIWGIPFLYAGVAPGGYHWLIPVLFFLLATADILLLSYFEKETDELDRHATLAVTRGKRSVKRIILVLCLQVLIIAVFLIGYSKTSLAGGASFIMIIMALSIMLMVVFERVFHKKQVYRYLSELVFWLPVLVYFFTA